jgi:hypothetical protein
MNDANSEQLAKLQSEFRQLFLKDSGSTPPPSDLDLSVFNL